MIRIHNKVTTWEELKITNLTDQEELELLERIKDQEINTISEVLQEGYEGDIDTFSDTSEYIDVEHNNGDATTEVFIGNDLVWNNSDNEPIMVKFKNEDND